MLKKHLPDTPYASLPEAENLVEIYDGNNQPFLLTPVEKARRLKLTRRIVLVSLKDTKKRIFVQRRSQTMVRHPDRWDIAVTSHVRAGESLVGAALRGMEQYLGLRGVRIKTFSSLPYEDTDGTKLLGSFFLAGPCYAGPYPDPSLVSDGMFLDRDELLGLCDQHPEMFTPELIWGARTGWIFH